MTLENLLHALLLLTPEQRKQELQVFDYSQDKFLGPVEICVEGEPEWHLTVEGG